MERLGIGPNSDVFGRLEAAYSEAHRHYHTSEHIEFCLRLLDEYRDLADNPDELELAIWFHDAVYKTRSKRNEEDSAEFARDFLLSNGVDGAAAQRVFDLILATRHDAPIDGQDTELLIDIDLAILGADEETFWRFEENVRREYRWVPGFLYRKERRKILQSFLDRPTLYACEALRVRFEGPARQNLDAAISQL